jgi:hydroxyacylglutathione hydrolase
VVAPARGGFEFPHRPVAESDEVRVGRVRLVAMETPGHTPEHISYVAWEGDAETPAAIFTGGSLMVGGAGRTDLLGPELTDSLTRSQFRTLRRLAGLPDEVEVFPTHGAGSFCGAGPPPATRTSTVGAERSSNPALAVDDEEAFVKQQLEGLLAYPAYYRFMAPINRSGPTPTAGLPSPRPLAAEEVAKKLEASEAWLVDARFRVPFARAHIPGSINVELDDAFASYVGWLVPFNAPLMLVLPEPEWEALQEASVQLLRIGYERLQGYLAGGIATWRAWGGSLGSYPVVGLEELCRRYRSGRPPAVLDVRQLTEWQDGSIPGSRHVFVGDLPGRLADISHDREVWAICRTGHRSAMAASLLDREGIPVRLVDGTGVPDFLRHCLAGGALP